VDFAEKIILVSWLVLSQWFSTWGVATLVGLFAIFLGAAKLLVKTFKIN